MSFNTVGSPGNTPPPSPAFTRPPLQPRSVPLVPFPRHPLPVALRDSVSLGALHDSPIRFPLPRCHPGTRNKVLGIIHHWIDDVDTVTRILWVHGPAGSGKSAIAQTVAELCRKQDKLAAAFFFFRASSDRNNGDRLCPTLAWQLASSVPQTSEYIRRAVEGAAEPVETQFDGLIVKPLRCASSRYIATEASKMIVIIDALDECAGETMQQRILTMISDAMANRVIPLRFLICSRPEPQIQDVFHAEMLRKITLSVSLEETADSLLDIELYLKDEFARIASKHRINSSPWPCQRDLEHLVRKSSGHFIYASTIIKFIDDKSCNPREQLDIVLGLKPNDSSLFPDLDQLYTEILVRQPDQEFLRDTLAIILTFSTLSGQMVTTWLTSDDICIINGLLGLEEEGVLPMKLRQMQSLLKATKTSLSLHHASFPDFLLSSARSGEYYMSDSKASKRFLELFSRALIRYASIAKRSLYVFSLFL
jgi:hypothetical protein